MALRQRDESSAIAFQLIAALERYEQLIGRLVEGQWDVGVYTDMSVLFEELRIYSASLPQVQVPWIEVLISRHELSHTVWAQHVVPGQGSARTENPDWKVRRLYSRHCAALAELHRRCMRCYTARVSA